MKSYTTVIIDDEKLARERLKKLLASFQETFTIVGEAKNGQEAEAMIDLLQPDLIFLDIEMPGQSGFELLRKINHNPIIIFCTAHEEYALKAFESNSIDYLVKPVTLERLQMTVKKVTSIKNVPHSQVMEIFNAITNQVKEKVMTSITIKKGDRIVFIKLEDVTYFEAKDKYVVVHTQNNTELTDQSLTKLESKLPEYFLRVHRGFIINTQFVKDFQKYFNSRYIVTLHDQNNSKITTGRSFQEKIKAWISI